MRRVLATASLLVGLGATLATPVSARDLDPAFGTRGVVRSSIGGIDDVARDKRGRLVAVGSRTEANRTDVFVARFLRNGALDRSFGTGGHIIRHFARGYSPDDARSWDYAQELLLDDRGRIVVAVSSQEQGFVSSATIARFLPTGATDRSFGRGRGYVRLGYRKHGYSDPEMDMQRDGKIVIAATHGFLASHDVILRLRPDGRLDRSFGRRGKIGVSFSGRDHCSYQQLADVKVLRSGSLLYAGALSGDFLLRRFLPDGRLDTKFGHDGSFRQTIESRRCSEVELSAAAIAPDGDVVLAGNIGLLISYREHIPLVLARVKAEGRTAGAFGRRGVVRTLRAGDAQASELTVLRKGSIVVAGASGSFYTPKFTVLRFLARGTLDRSFNKDGIFSRSFTPESWASSVIRAPRGRMIVAGGFQTASRQGLVLTRFLP